MDWDLLTIKLFDNFDNIFLKHIKTNLNKKNYSYVFFRCILIMYQFSYKLKII